MHGASQACNCMSVSLERLHLMADLKLGLNSWRLGHDETPAVLRALTLGMLLDPETCSRKRKGTTSVVCSEILLQGVAVGFSPMTHGP